MLYVKSGSCVFCEVGIPTKEKDEAGNELFTGDLVQLWHCNFKGADYEEWVPSGLTFIVANKYETYGSMEGFEHKLVDEGATPFTMGIANIGVQGGDWKVDLVTSHKDVFNGFRIKPYGMSVQELDL